MNNKILSLALSVFLILFTMTATAAMTGEEILDKVDEVLDAETRDTEMSLTIVNANDQTRERTIRIISKDGKDDDKGLVRFLSPSDVEGTGLLTIKEGEEDNMWLYLPTLGNVRKIASHQKNGSFMGTDFTYKDINMVGGSNYRDDYDSKLSAEEDLDGESCYLLETIPVDEEIEYSRMKMWVRKDDYMPLKLEFYDQNEKLLKVMTNSEITIIDGHITPQKIVMENVQEGTKTILNLDQIKYDTDIPDNLFSTRYLERG